MNLKAIPITVICLSILMFNSCDSTSENDSVDYPITPVDFTQVKLQDGFWKDWVKTARDATIPFAFQKCEETGRIDNFIFAGGIREGNFRGRFGFNDSDLYKIMEGAAYSLMLEDDPEMEAYLDTLIYYISEAQEEDGYLYTAWTLKANEYNDFALLYLHDEGQWIGTPDNPVMNFIMRDICTKLPWPITWPPANSSFLDVAMKNADLIYDVCITQGNDYVPGHQEIEIGLAKLYRVTGDERYLELAKHFLDIRADVHGGGVQPGSSAGHRTIGSGGSCSQGQLHVQCHGRCGCTDRRFCLPGSHRADYGIMWYRRNYPSRGAWEPVPRGEAYGENYDLPNHPYNETCAAIANVYWNHRMFLLHGDAKYMDVLERTLYNGVISGLIPGGTLFFYPNTLQHDGEATFNQGVNGRSPWFDCSCCPSNLSRFIPSVAGYAYAVRGEDVYVNLFMNSAIAHGDNRRNQLEIEQQSNYPWDGCGRVADPE